MGLAEVLKTEGDVEEAKMLIEKMKPLFNKLDTIIKETVKKTYDR